MALDKKLSTQTTLERLTELLKQSFAKKADLPTKVSQLTNDSGFQTAQQVQTAINTKIASVYKPAGSKSAAELTEELLVVANEGHVYNVTEEFTSTGNFIEGAGKKFPAGTDVAVVIATPAHDDTPATYKFNVMAGFVDTSGLMDRIASAQDGNLIGMDSTGNAQDSGIAANAVATKYLDEHGKIANASSHGNIVTLTTDGKLQDSKVDAASLMPKATEYTADNLAKFTNGGNVIDSQIKVSDIVTTADIQDYTSEELQQMLGLS